MKKVLFSLIMLCLVFSLCACGEQSKTTETEEETSIATQQEESTKTEVEDPEPEEPVEEEFWIMQYYVDEFNDPTSEAFISPDYYIEGTFSNSATTNSSLLTGVVIDNTDITITLVEYGNNIVENSSSTHNETYSIIMKTPDGTKHNISGVMGAGQDRIFINSEYKQMVLDALMGTGDVSFYIQSDSRTTTQYLFKLPTANFKDVYQKFTN